MGIQLSPTGWLPSACGFVEIVVTSSPGAAPPLGRCGLFLSASTPGLGTQQPLGLQRYGQSSVPDQQGGCELRIQGANQPGQEFPPLPTPLGAQASLLGLPGSAERQYLTRLPYWKLLLTLTQVWLGPLFECLHSMWRPAGLSQAWPVRLEPPPPIPL